MSRFFSTFLLSLVATLSFLGVFGVSAPVLAQSATDSLEVVNETAGLGENDVKQTIASIIRIVLGFLGILAVLIVLYGGFTWMTAGGNEEKLARAKKTLLSGVIGLTIVLLSYAIASFILSAILHATQSDGGGGGGGGSGSGSGLGGGSTSSFTVTDFSPDSAVAIRNVQLRVTFSKNVDEETVAGNITVTDTSTGEVVDGTLDVSGNRVTFVPTAPCPTPNEDRFCFAADTAFDVRVTTDVESTSGNALVCSSTSCTSSFTTGSLVDTEDPEVTVTEPESGDGVPTDSSQTVQVHATDDSEVSGADFAADGAAFDSVGASGEDLSDVTIATTWDTSGLANGDRVTLTATVTDIAGNTSDDTLTVTMRPAWCFNGVLDSDAGETGIDCGGDSGSDEYCGACDGASCVDDSECSSGSCVEGVCTSLPEIASISPGDGAVGAYVTIAGSGFGTAEGTVTFASATGTTEALLPDCGDGWSDTEIVVEVPSDAVDGPITVTTSDDLSDATNDDAGVLIDDFDVNDTVRPKLCSLSVGSGEPTDGLTLSGKGFGDSQTDSTILFDATEAGSYVSWEDASARVTVPSVEDGEYAVTVVVDGVASNARTFTVESDTSDAPSIAGIDPDAGVAGDYVTLTGTNFGASTGTVWFVSEESGESALADTDFPDACAEDFWNPDEITVIVPDAFQSGAEVTPGAYTVYVATSGGDTSSSVDFTIEDGDPAPGICALSPDSGAAGDTLTVYGERLGASEGVVTFYDGLVATLAEDGWSDEEITVTVPSGVVTGPVMVTSDAGEESNTLDFEVGASSGVTATAMPATYGWYFSTGEIPESPEVVVECSDDRVSAVPNARYTSEVCTNAVVYAEFSVLMNEGTIDDAFMLEECTAGGDRPCSSTTEIDGALDVASSADMTYFTFVPTALTPSTTYRVTISTAATSAASGTGNTTPLASDVTWEFTTKSSDAACGVEEVRVSPSSSLIDEQYGTDAFHAVPTTGCVVVEADDYAWSWDVDESYAAFTTSLDGTCDGGTTSCATVVGNAEGETAVTATETSSSADGAAALVINFVDPYVTYVAPDCTEACRDATVGATFNTSMNESSIETPGAVLLYECANELCVNMSEFGTYSVACDDDGDTDACSSFIITHDNLTVGAYYRVVVSGDVTSLSGIPLTRTNYSGDYSWIFRVKDDDTACAVARVTVTPDAVTAGAVGESQEFRAHAYGAPDSCSVAGQELQSTNYDWSWTNPIADDGASAAIAVAEWWMSGLVDTDTEDIAAGCTASCVPGGSESYAAICGDSSIDDGEDCDDGDTRPGDGCSNSCLREGANTIGTCGDGVLDRNVDGAGEDCDDGNTVSGDGCSSACLNEGSTAVDSVCGNADIAYDATRGGEECEDGNVRSGDGCSSQCLNEGSVTLADVGGAVCGNGTVDSPYEECDTALTPEGCSDRCLFEGSSALYATPSVCGDGVPGIGEACDEGDAVDGDGCSSDCLYEGSSLAFASPSVCGDGIQGAGEVLACESGGGDLFIDALQLASIADDAAAEVDTTTHTAVASIEVTEPSSGFSTTSSYTLECSAASDSDCPDTDIYGVGTNNCCFERPTAVLYPSGSDVCRNSAIYGTFTSEMSLDSFMASNGDGTEAPLMYATLDLAASGLTSCPDGHTTLALAGPDASWLAKTWVNVRQLVTGITARAASGDCVVEVTGFRQVEQTDGTFRVYMEYGAALSANATYTLTIEGDDKGTDAMVLGVTSAYGVGMNMESNAVPGIQTQSFVTGDDICVLDEVQVEDADDESPNYFSQDNEEHRFVATAYSHTMLDEGQEIAPIVGVYDWTWSSWDDDRNGSIVSVTQDTGTTSEADVAAIGNNGNATVTATATIATDVAGGTAGDAIVGEADVTAFLCENPWPSISVFPWQDNATGGTNGNAFEGDAWMNFSSYYCRDAGEDSGNGFCSVTTSDTCESDSDCPDAETCVGDTSADADDLDAATVVLADDRGITGDVVMKEYILRLGTGSDAIGVRIAQNPDYLSPMQWFTEQGFSGSPEATTVDGFDAVTDGRTTYVAAPNEVGGDLYANMYIISYNEGASDNTIEVYDQLLENFTFATNLDDTALCYDAGGALATNLDGDTVVCGSDQDCDAANGEYCGDMKSKLLRDVRRMADLKDLSVAVDAYGTENGQCSDTTAQSCTEDGDCPTGETCEATTPALSSGTELRGVDASTWTSWEDVLLATVDADTLADPLNTYVDCGEGAYADYNSETCVNATKGEYVCPEGSHVYHYRAVGNQDYVVYADLEYDGADWVNDIDDDTTDNVTFVFGGASATTTASGFTTSQTCDGTVYGGFGLCGDGIVNTSIDSDGDGTADTAETCEIGERGGTATACTDDDGNAGTVSQVCNSSCSGWETDADAVCVPTSCGNGIVEDVEECDDGTSNGRYGYCGSLCTYDSAMVCGDGELQGSEVCDCGAASLTSSEFSAISSTARPYGGTPGACAGINGTYDANDVLTCAWDCSGPASYCGDAVVDSDEQCDTAPEAWEGELCNAYSTIGTFGQACTSDADCVRFSSSSTDALCGDASSSNYQACPESTVCIASDDDDELGTVCSTDSDCGTGGDCSSTTYQTYRVRTCEEDSCTWDAAYADLGFYGEECVALGSCGDGTVDAGEECDDGNDDSTDDCTNACLNNVCGDGYLYVGEEDCDEGGDNGASCSANYESSCTACSTSCHYTVSSGEFCGDGVVNGDEYCDAYDIPYQWLDAYGIEAGTCDRDDAGQTYSEVYGMTYTYTDGSGLSSNPTCTNVGICNGGSDNGDYCDSDEDCDSGQCVMPTCAASCTSSCPMTYDDTTALLTSNAVGARASSSVDLYTYSDSSTSDVPNAATLTLPACSAISSITADVSMDAVEPPDTYIVFITDLSSSMGDPATSSSSSWIELAQASITNAADDLYEALGDSVHLGAVAYLSENCGGGDIDLGTDYEGIEDVLVQGFVDESDADDFEDEIDAYTTGCGTYTFSGMQAAMTLLDSVPEEENQLKIAVLLSEDDYRDTSGSADADRNPEYIACRMKDAGYQLYTAALSSTTASNTSAGTECDEYKDADGDYYDTWEDYETAVHGTPFTTYASNDAPHRDFTVAPIAPVSASARMGQRVRAAVRDALRAVVPEAIAATCADGTDAYSSSDTNWASIMACWSSGNPKDGIDYAHSGDTGPELQEIYDEIIDSILGSVVTIISDDADGDGSVEQDIGAVREGVNVELPWPTGFVCDPSSEQDLPVRFSFYGEGQIEVSNVRINYCAP